MGPFIQLTLVLLMLPRIVPFSVFSAEPSTEFDRIVFAIFYCIIIVEPASIIEGLWT
jgi:hypothetical protein